MRAVRAAEAINMDHDKIVSTLAQLGQVVDLASGEPLSGVFHIFSMDVDQEKTDGSLIVTLVEETEYGFGDELHATMAADTILIVDINF